MHNMCKEKVSGGHTKNICGVEVKPWKSMHQHTDFGTEPNKGV